MSPFVLLAATATVLQLAIDPAELPRDVSLPALASEVRAIWDQHVEVITTKPGESCLICDRRLELHVSEVPPAGGPDSMDALGWIEFIDGRPKPQLTVSITRARRLLADGVWMGRRLRLLPRLIQTRILSTAIGRAVAHEIGHYVLQSRMHQPAGLMRARFTLRDFMDPDSTHFRLTPGDAARLEASRTQAHGPASR